MKFQDLAQKIFTVTVIASATGLAGCTKSDAFRLKQVEQKFSAAEVNTSQVDMLWVVDNSASMEPSQEKLRKGFSQFAKKYLKPNWDIRTAVITTDTFLANPIFNQYLNQPI